MHFNRKLTDEQELEIVRLYKENEPLKEIYKKFNIGRKTVDNALKRYNIQRSNQERRRIKCNESFFEIIDTEAKAYFLGLMMADGTVLDNNRIAISLTEIDINILNKFKQVIEYEGNIYIYNRKDKNKVISSNKPININPNCFIGITSKKLHDDLILHGCVPRKSLVLKWPIGLPENLTNHFCRGYLDGDGWIIIKEKYGTAESGIISSHKFCEEFAEKIKEILNIGFCIRKDKKSKGISRVDINGSNNFLKFCEWLYKDATIYLERKYNKYLKAKKIIEENRINYREKLDNKRKGKNNGRSFLTEEIIKSIRQDYKNRIRPIDIELKYALKHVHVQKIIHNKIWRHI